MKTPTRSWPIGFAERLRGATAPSHSPSPCRRPSPAPSIMRSVQITQTSETTRVSISTHCWELEKKLARKKKTVKITNFKDCSVIKYASAMLVLLFFLYIFFVVNISFI